MPDAPRLFEWEFYETSNGRKIVREEIRTALKDKAALVALGQLMSRLEHGRTLPRDTRSLGQGLFEARLSDLGNEYRLYYAHVGGVAILLGLPFQRKGGQGAQQRAIGQARQRLAAWRQRGIR